MNILHSSRLRGRISMVAVLCATGLIFLPGSALAQNTTQSGRSGHSAEKIESKHQQKTEKTITKSGQKAKAQEIAKAQQCLSSVKKRAGEAVAKRVKVVNTLSLKVAQSTSVSQSHKTTLTQRYEEVTQGLQTVQAQVEAATTCETAKTAAKAIFEDYRVFAVLVPQSRLVLAADRAQTGTEKVAAALKTVETAIAEQEAAGADVQAARELFNQVSADVAAAQTALSGVADRALAITPADFPAGEALATERQKIAQAKTSLKKAVTGLTSLSELLG